jgi:hypothetical protein
MRLEQPHRLLRSAQTASQPISTMAVLVRARARAARGTCRPGGPINPPIWKRKMNRLSHQNEQESESHRPESAHPPKEPFWVGSPEKGNAVEAFVPSLNYARLLPNPFLGLPPIERENRAAAGTTTIILRPVNRRGPASPLADKCSDQIEFDFQNSSSWTEREIYS